MSRVSHLASCQRITYRLCVMRMSPVQHSGWFRRGAPRGGSAFGRSQHIRTACISVCATYYVSVRRSRLLHESSAPTDVCRVCDRARTDVDFDACSLSIALTIQHAWWSRSNLRGPCYKGLSFGARTASRTLIIKPSLRPISPHEQHKPATRLREAWL